MFSLTVKNAKQRHGKVDLGAGTVRIYNRNKIGTKKTTCRWKSNRIMDIPVGIWPWMGLTSTEMIKEPSSVKHLMNKLPFQRGNEILDEWWWWWYFHLGRRVVSSPVHVEEVNLFQPRSVSNALISFIKPEIEEGGDGKRSSETHATSRERAGRFKHCLILDILAGSS